MDAAMQAVLDRYHERMARERAMPRPAGDGDLDTRLLAVGPQTGQLLNVLARSLKQPRILELGTSYGYSGIWLADAARASGGRLVTMELSAGKSAHAQEMSREAGLDGHVDFRVGDAVEMIGSLEAPIDFVLVDLWNSLYLPCFRAFAPKLAPGAIIVSDNIRPGDPGTAGYIAALKAHPGMVTMPLPVGSGLEISRWLP